MIIKERRAKDGKIIECINKIEMANLAKMGTTKMVITKIITTKITKIDKEGI
jgi:hypothetical protein